MRIAVGWKLVSTPGLIAAASIVALSTARAGTPSPDLTSHILEYQTQIADTFDDPESTRFRHVHAVSGCKDCQGSGAASVLVCGEVLSKNGFGAYTGWHHFASFMKPWSDGTALIQSFNLEEDSDFPAESFDLCMRDQPD